VELVAIGSEDAEALRPARVAGGQDQHQRPGLARHADSGPAADPGLQRADRVQREPDHRGRPGHRRCARLRHLAPIVKATLRALQNAGVEELPETFVADAGYWHKTQMQTISEQGFEVLVPPDGGLREGARPGWEDGLYALMRRVLSTDRGQQIYRQRKITVEPVYGQIKFNRRIDRFQRRGRSAARSEWRLVAATHNLLKLHTHWIANTA
jgi:Transposase DDE domain